VGQLERYHGLPRAIAELHAHMGYPELVAPDRRFVRRDDG